MSATVHAPGAADWHRLARQGRAQVVPLLDGADDPHAELLAMVWGPRFDREAALSLWTDLSQRRPVEAAPMLPQLLRTADAFDALARAQQHRLRQFILRHRAQRDTTPMEAMSE